MKRRNLFLLVPAGLLALGLPTQLKGQARPRTVAFVVGVENYDDADLNKLQYTAKDASDFFRQLEAVTDLQKERSKLLLASKDLKEYSEKVQLLHRAKLTEGAIRSEFRRFLDKVESDDHVIFYFGGHGTTQDNNLLYLPSDFSRRPRDHYLRFDTLIREIKSSFDSRRLRNVSVAFFANMCGAGTAAGDMSVAEDPDTEFVKRWLEENTLGFRRFALFPASAPNRNTHESEEWKRSVFAHHLIEGLKGGAASGGAITADGLFKYLDERIEDDLPRIPAEFDGSITIGVTRHLEGVRYLFSGLSILAYALEADDQHYWEVVDRNLSEAVRLIAEPGPRALAALRRAQVRVLAKRSPDEIAEALNAVQKNWLGPEHQAEFDLLAERYQNQDQGFFGVVLQYDPPGYNLGGQSWVRFLQSSPGVVKTATLDLSALVLPGQDGPHDSAFTVGRIIKKLQTFGIPFPGTRPLVLIYAGTGGVDKDERLLPLDVEDYKLLVKSWAQPVTLVYDAPFGGYLREPFQAGEFDPKTSLVLSAREKNGMTFAGGPWSTEKLMVQMIQSGVTGLEGLAPFTEYRKQVQEWVDKSQVVGTPFVGLSSEAPSPILGRDIDQARLAAENSLAPLQRFAAAAALGCFSGRPEGCARIEPGPLETSLVSKGLESVDSLPEQNQSLGLFETLKTAAALDVRGDQADAAIKYGQVLDSISDLYNSEEASGLGQEVKEAVDAGLERLRRLVEYRLSVKPRSRKVFLILAPAYDYSSPLIPDLSGPPGDLAVWQEFATETFGPSELKIRHIENSRSRKDILGVLRETAAEAAGDDLIIFIFSGRGLEYEGERYLVPTGVDPYPLEALYVEWEARDVNQELRWEPSHKLVRLREIAELVRNDWFIGIYDAQFSDPVASDVAAVDILEKHMVAAKPQKADSKRALTDNAKPQRFLPADSSTWTSDPDNGYLPASHVHIWWEGSLSEKVRPSASPLCDQEHVRSPMSAGLLSTLEKQRRLPSYRYWIERAMADECSYGSGEYFGLVAQGAVDLPPFATGQGSRMTQYFLSPRERWDFNLYTALALVEKMQAAREPLARVTLASVLLALAEASRTGVASPVIDAPVQSLYERALEILEELHREQPGSDEEGLHLLSLDLLTRALLSSRKIDRARELLLGEPPEHLASTSLQQRLLSVTEASLLRSPDEILRETEKILQTLGDNGVSVEDRIFRRWAAIRKAYSKLESQYRLSISRDLYR